MALLSVEVRKMASSLRNMFCGFIRNQNSRSVLYGTARGYSRWRRAYFREMYKRRQEIGPEPERHRSVWINWNYDAEIFAFGRRLGENFNETTLRRAFTHKSYIEQEEQKRVELDIGEEKASLGVEDNEALVKTGESVCSEYVKAYLRHALPLMPEEGITAVHDHLLTDAMLAHIGGHLGMKDLILSKDLRVDDETLGKTFRAVVGALCEDEGKERAGLFIQDFILTQLIDKDINDMWTISNPMGVLGDILAKQNKGPPESRLLRQSGSETVVAVYVVGIYSNKELIGQSAGETVFIGEEMAARDALNRMFRTTEGRTPFKFGQEGRSLTIDYTKENASLSDLTGRFLQ